MYVSTHQGGGGGGAVQRQLTLYWFHNFLFIWIWSLICQNSYNIECMYIVDLEIANKISIYTQLYAKWYKYIHRREQLWAHKVQVYIPGTISWGGEGEIRGEERVALSMYIYLLNRISGGVLWWWWVLYMHVYLPGRMLYLCRIVDLLGRISGGHVLWCFVHASIFTWKYLQRVVGKDTIP